jgi:tRNA threonylcarbamoyladenosine biosynthesis protein TsaB
LKKKNSSKLIKTDTYILLIESSTTNCSVGLACGEKLLVVRESNAGYRHAEHLPLFVDEVLQEGQITPQQLSAISIGMGPGSYTGLRIGASMAKGISYGLGIPIIGINSTEVLAATYLINALEDDKPIVAMIDSRQGEVYAGVYDHNLRELMPPEPFVIGDGDGVLRTYLDSGVPAVGPGAAKYGEDVVRYIEIYPSAKGMARGSFERFLIKEFLDTAYFEPSYMKEFYSRRQG